jgi:hypothetical protein
MSGGVAESEQQAMRLRGNGAKVLGAVGEGEKAEAATRGTSVVEPLSGQS